MRDGTGITNRAGLGVGKNEGRTTGRRSVRVGAVLGLVAGTALVLAACEGSGGNPGGGGSGAMPAATVGASATRITASSTALGPAPLPVYSVGDTYVFDTPRETWTIADVTDEKVTWQSDLGGSRQTTLDPLLPSLRSSAPEIGAVTRIITEKDGELWPLAVGNESTFVVAAGMDQPPYSQSLAWSCRVVGTNLVAVPAGQFNTFKIACARSDGLRLNTYYAPAIGYFVRREVSTADNQGQARSLVAYKNGTGDRLVAGQAPGAAAMNPLGTETGAVAPVSTADVTPLEPIDGTASAGAVGGASASALDGPIEGSPMEGTPDGGAPTPLVSGPAQAPSSAPAPGPAAAAPSTPLQTQTPASGSSAATVAAAPGVWSGNGVRLASFRTEAAALSGWGKLQAAYPALLGSLSPRVVQVQIDGRGTFHRLYAGPFSSQDAAKGVCGKIAEMGQTCDVQAFR